MASKRFRKALKRFGRSVKKVVKYAAPVAGALIGGPAALAIGTGVGTLAGVAGAKNKGKALKRGLIFGAGLGAATVGLGALSGAGPGAGLITSVPKLLGFGGSPAAPSDQGTVGQGLEAGLPSAATQGLEPFPGGGIDLARFGSFLGRAAEKNAGLALGAGGEDENGVVQRQFQGGSDAAGGGGFFGGSATGGEAESGPFGIPMPVLLVGGGLLVLAMAKGRKAA